MNPQTDYEKAKENIAQKECGGDPYSETVFQHGFDFGRKYTIEEICAFLESEFPDERTHIEGTMRNGMGKIAAEKIMERFK